MDSDHRSIATRSLQHSFDLLTQNQVRENTKMIEMKQSKHRKLFRWLRRAAIAFAASLNLTAVTAGEFGFNYWPQDVFGCDALVTDAKWLAQKHKVAADLDYMKSLGATVLRLPFWPGGSGFILKGVDYPKLDVGACKNLPAMLALIKARGFKVIIAFPNPRTVQDSPNNWKDIKKYKDAPNGADLFAEDSVKWINSIVNLIESPANNPELSSMILYYDMVNEYDHRITTLANYFRWVYLNSSIPQNKKGVSVLHAKGTTTYGGDFDGLPIPAPPTNPWYSITQQLAALTYPAPPASLSFIDFHSYPVVPNTILAWGCPANADTANSYDYLFQRVPPSTKVVIGEFGRRVRAAPNDQVEETFPYLSAGCGTSIPPFPDSTSRKWDEAGQKETVKDIISIATTKSIPYYLHWMLWDNSPPVQVTSDLDPAAQIYGMGYGPHLPKDVLGWVAERFSMIPNSDFEITTSSEVITGWSKGGSTQGTSLRSSYVASPVFDPYAATNKVYARLEATPACGSSCTAWIQSELIDIRGMPANGKIYVNAYIRSNFTEVSVNIAQFDGTHQLTSRPPKTIAPSAYSWSSYLHRIYETAQVVPEVGWGFTPDPNATHVIVTIGGKANTATSNAYLDVDTVSMHW
jgi:hypothetical protein